MLPGNRKWDSLNGCGLPADLTWWALMANQGVKKVLLDPPKTRIKDPVLWIESKLKVPTGPLTGKPFKLLPEQRDWLHAALKPGIMESGYSCPRKTGKTGFVAAAILWFMVGGGREPNWRGRVMSLNGKLAIELREAIQYTARISGFGEDVLRVYVAPPPGRIVASGNIVVTLDASDKATGHASSNDLVICDEMGLFVENTRTTVNAMLSSTSVRDGRFWGISVRGHSSMFREMGERADDPSVHWEEWAADRSDDMTDPATWHKCTPGLGTVKSIAYMERASRRAVLTPANAQDFRAFDLNAEVDPGKELLVPLHEWKQCLVDELPPRGDDWCVVGLDLGGAVSLCAAAIYFPSSGRLECWGAFPGIPNLNDRGLADGVGQRYALMQGRGELLSYPGRSNTPVVPFLGFISDVVGNTEVKAIVSDRFRDAESMDFYRDAGIRWPRVFRGVGHKDAGEDVRAFQTAVYTHKVQVKESLLLENAIAGSAIVYDPALNPKVDKQKNRSRIDPAVACVLAIGEAERLNRRKRGGWRHLGTV